MVKIISKKSWEKFVILTAAVLFLSFTAGLAESAAEKQAPTLEDTVKYQIGGELYYTKVPPGDSITVIKTEYGELRDGVLLRAYMFINHNKHSQGHKHFEPTYLEKIYESARREEFFADIYATALSRGKIFSGIGKFDGYWIYVEKFGEDYYLFDSWVSNSSFHIAGRICTIQYMDGPLPCSIVDFESCSDGFTLSTMVPSKTQSEISTWKFRLVEERRSIYHSDEGKYIAPAANVHQFEIIHYVVNCKDLYVMKLPEAETIQSGTQ